MSAVADVIVPIITALCGGGAMKALEWWGKQRDAARAAALAITTQRVAADQSAAERRAAADQSATDKLLAAYEAQATQAERRATDAAEGRAAVARALTDVAHASMEQAKAIDDHTAASRESREHMANTVGDIRASLARLEAQHSEILAVLRGRPS